MLLIIVFNLVVSMTTLLLVKIKKNVKHARVLMCVNITQIVLQLLIFIICKFLIFFTSPEHPIINDGRAFGMWETFIHTLLGVVVLFFNIILLLKNHKEAKDSVKETLTEKSEKAKKQY